MSPFQPDEWLGRAYALMMTRIHFNALAEAIRTSDLNPEVKAETAQLLIGVLGSFNFDPSRFFFAATGFAYSPGLREQSASAQAVADSPPSSDGGLSATLHTKDTTDDTGE